MLKLSLDLLTSIGDRGSSFAGFDAETGQHQYAARLQSLKLKLVVVRDDIEQIGTQMSSDSGAGSAEKPVSQLVAPDVPAPDEAAD